MQLPTYAFCQAWPFLSENGIRIFAFIKNFIMISTCMLWLKPYLSRQRNLVQGFVRIFFMISYSYQQLKLLRRSRCWQLIQNKPVEIFLFVFHSHDLTRTCFQGMYWVLPWECSCPKGGIIQSVIARWSDCIAQDRDSHHLGTLSTVLQHFTYTMKPSNPLMLTDAMTLCAAGCILQAKLTSLET